MYVAVCLVDITPCAQQKMRTPPQATINIVEEEDVAGMAERAKYHSMQNQASQLMLHVSCVCVCVSVTIRSKLYVARSADSK